MENILHELDIFNKNTFLNCFSEYPILHILLKEYWNKWIKLSRVEIPGEFNTQFVYTISFTPFVEDIEKELRSPEICIWNFIESFQKVIIKHFEKLDYIYIQKDKQFINKFECYSKGFFIPSDNILTFIWVTSFED